MNNCYVCHSFSHPRLSCMPLFITPQAVMYATLSHTPGCHVFHSSSHPRCPIQSPRRAVWVDMVLDAATCSLTGLCLSSVHHSSTHPRCPTTAPLTGMSHLSPLFHHSSQSHHSFQSVTCPRWPMLSRRRAVLWTWCCLQPPYCVSAIYIPTITPLNNLATI